MTRLDSLDAWSNAVFGRHSWPRALLPPLARPELPQRNRGYACRRQEDGEPPPTAASLATAHRSHVAAPQADGGVEYRLRDGPRDPLNETPDTDVWTAAAECDAGMVAEAEIWLGKPQPPFEKAAPAIPQDDGRRNRQAEANKRKCKNTDFHRRTRRSCQLHTHRVARCVPPEAAAHGHSPACWSPPARSHRRAAGSPVGP